MSRITKLELSQINTRLARENEALRAENAQLHGDVERLKADLNTGSALVEMLSRPTERVARHMPAWQAQRGAAMAAAKALAMQQRCVVKV